jgi:ParB family transcriptional regulator, chromosome partitioning protein
MSYILKVLPIGQLQTNPFQPRDKIKSEDIAELAESIKTYGILEPLVVAHTPAGYQIIAGERRWRASKMAGLTEVPVHVKKTTPKQMLEMAVVENVQRTDLSALERAQAFQQLMVEFGLNHQQIANRIGKSDAYISNTVRLLKLPDAIKDSLAENQITEGHARALLSITDERIMMQCFRQVVKEKASVRRAEELARHHKQTNDLKTNPTALGAKSISEERVNKIREKVKTHFHSKSDFKLTRSARQTKLTIILKGNVAKTQADMERALEILSAN